MPETLTMTTYAFKELSEKAQAKALDARRQDFYEGQWFDAEYILEDAKTQGKTLGLFIDKIHYSGFSSQGDGACFIGEYRYEKGAAQKIRHDCPTETELHRIADALQAVQRPAFYDLVATVTNGYSNYCHERSVDILVERRLRPVDVTEAQDEAVQEALRDFMRWIYRSLEAEWDYQSSDEALTESLESNDYRYTEHGGRCFLL